MDERFFTSGAVVESSEEDHQEVYGSADAHGEQERRQDLGGEAQRNPEQSHRAKA